MEAGLVVDPGVVQLSVEKRALESFDDGELRIESGLDRKLAQEALAERMNRLRPERLDAPGLCEAGAPVVGALAGGHFEGGSSRADGPGDLVAAVEANGQLGQRLVNAV